MHCDINHGAVFVGPVVVVGGDAAHSAALPIAHGDVAQIRQLVGFGAFGFHGVFGLKKSAKLTT
ncbi:hypothetical protein [Limnohabitans sp.]|uniref:hypothetical protein n=1 Tax=Limnohabitans sp. TaxID=1907725 RepID=UPI0025C5A48A|nr:hypothetical protein [Limnohabitans sp.]